MMTTPSTQRKMDRSALAVGVGAFLLYLCGLSPFGIPGESARQLVQHAGLDPFPPMTHPLWYLCVKFLVWVPVSTLAYRAAVFSAACTAVAVGLFFILAAGIGRRQDEDGALSRLAGWSGALFLAVSAPVWLVATRAHPGSLDLLLTVLLLVLLRRGIDQRNRRTLLAFCFLYGVGMAEFATLMVLAPFLFLYLLAHLLRQRRLSLPLMVCMLLAGGAGLLLYFWHAWLYTRTPAFAWRGFSGMPEVVWHMGVEQWRLIRGSVGRTGWILVFLVSAAPWCMAVWRSRRRRKKRSWGAMLIHGLLLAAAVVILFNGPIAPWTYLGAGALRVTPYLFVAGYFTYAAVFWVSGRWRSGPHQPPPSPRTLRAAAAVVLALAIGAGVRNAPAMSTRPAAAIDAWASAVIQAMGARTRLITDGFLDDHILLAAHEEGKPLHLLNAGMTRFVPYSRYLASLFAEPRLQSMAGVGLTALIKEWILTDPDAYRELAVLPAMDLWLAHGFVAVPDRAIYLGERSPDAIAADALWARNRDFWKGWVPEAERLAASRAVFAVAGDELLYRAARTANDLGVLMEHLDRTDLAVEAYRQARAIRPANLSALLNLALLLEPSDAVAAAQAWKEAEAVLGRSENRQALGRLVARYGHIRSAGAMQRLLDGLEMVRPDEEVMEDLRAALRHYARGEHQAARDLLDRFVERHPEIDDGWVMLGLIADLQGDEARWDRCVAEMEKGNKRWGPILAIEGRRALNAGELNRAREKLEAAITASPRSALVLESLLKLEMLAGRPEETAKYAAALLNVDPGSAWGNFALGIQEYQSGAAAAAEAAFRRSIASLPLPQALNNLAWLLHEQGRNEEALSLARAAVEKDPKMQAGWDTLGSVLLATGDRAGAEEALDHALKLRPEAVTVRAHYALLLEQLDRPDEARAVLRELLRDPGTLSPALERSLREQATRLGVPATAE